MPRIVFDDDQNNGQKPRQTGRFLVVFLVLALVMGMIGATTSLIILSENAPIRRILGIKEDGTFNLARTVTEKLVIEESNGFIQTVKKVSPAVVSITTKTEGTDFFGRVIEREGAGTGFIITTDGLIVTNKHVVSDENSTYTVATTDGKKFDAQVKARDAFADLAILKIEATGLPVVELGDSDSLEVGQWVVAIGNALGQFQNSVSVGVVSAKDRRLDNQGSTELTGLVQTDATINPGNSGGPLVNLKGQVIGINTAIASTTGSSIGIGFAIPVNSVKKAIDSVRKTGKITRPMLGVRYVPLDAVIAKELGLKVENGNLIVGEGVRAPGVLPGGPAEKAGLQERDIILELNGERLDGDKSLASVLNNYSPGEVVTLKVLRADKELTMKVTLEELK